MTQAHTGEPSGTVEADWRDAGARHGLWPLMARKELERTLPRARGESVGWLMSGFELLASRAG